MDKLQTPAYTYFTLAHMSVEFELKNVFGFGMY